MEIVSIEAGTYRAMMFHFEAFARKVDALCEPHIGKKLDEWLDNQDVCLILNISPRTLQNLRETGKLPYSQINRKMYYKPEDVEKVINNAGL